MKTYQLSSCIGIAAAALALSACVMDEVAEEGDIDENITNAQPWADAPGVWIRS